MRLHLAAAIVAASVLAPVATATAEPPIKLPPPGEVIVNIPEGGTPCGAFTLSVNDQSKGRVFTRPDGTEIIHFAGQITATLQSVATGKSIDLQPNGPLQFRANDIVLLGNILFFDPTHLEYIKGRVQIPNDPSQPITITGNRLALCPLLA